MNKNAESRARRLFAGVNSSLSRTDPEFVEIISNFSQDETANANILTEKERMLCILAALLGCQGMGEFQNMLHAALNIGVDPVAIKETIYQATAYLGIGRTCDFLIAANGIMEQHGVRLPLAPQASTNEEARFERGLAKQVELFGPDMAKRQTDGPALRRNINRWLADNCFGDYYTRGGLDYKQREMITFCFLAALGGCEPQLTSHAGANLRIGNDNAFLIQVISQCLPYIGYPRSLNALRCVNDAAQAAR